MEELREGSLGGPSQMDPAALAALHEAQQLEGKPVFDVNGDPLGKITRCFAEDRTLVRCDVTLSSQARDLFEARDRDVAQVPPSWIASVDDEGVRLRKAGDELLHPENDRAFNDGAKELPRKVR